MIRRHILSALALVALAAVVAAPAQAGGTSGAVGVKKTANVKIKNVGSTNTYVVVIPQGLAAPVTVNDAKRLGAIMRPANSGAIFYPVPSGNGVIAVIDAASVPSSGVLPPPDDTVGYSVGKGKIADGVITATEQTGADLIVLYRHTRGGLNRKLLGSVSDELIRRSAVPVLLVGAAIKTADGTTG